MDEQYRRAFLKASARCKPRDLRPRSLSIDDFLDAVPDEAEVPKIATDALKYFCLDENGNFNNYNDGLFAALYFVQDVTGKPVIEKQLLADLKVMLSTKTTENFTAYLKSFLDVN